MSSLTSPRLLRAAVALGLTLAFGSLSHAAGLAAQRGPEHLAKVEAHKAAIATKIAHEQLVRQQRAELEVVINAPLTSDSRIGLLASHHRAFPSEHCGPPVLEHDGAVFEVHDRQLVIVVKDGTSRKAKPADLARAGIVDKQSFAAAVTKQLHALSGIAPNGSNHEAALEVVRDKVSHADDVLSQFVYHSDVNLIKNHHSVVTTGRVPAGFASWVHFGGIAGKDELALGILGIGRLKDGKKGNKLSYLDLEAHGITTPEKAETHIEHQLVRIAGLAGDPSHPDVVAAARAKLTQEREDVEMLQTIVNGTHKHYASDIEFLRNAHAMMSPRANGQPYDIILGERKGATLQLGPAPGRVVLVDTANPTGRPATIADLHTFGIDHKADFDTAMGDAVLRLAEEDFDH